MSGESLTWALGRTAAEASRVEDGTFQFALPSGELFDPPLFSLDGSCDGSESVLGPGESLTLTVLCKPRELIILHHLHVHYIQFVSQLECTYKCIIIQ